MRSFLRRKERRVLGRNACQEKSGDKIGVASIRKTGIKTLTKSDWNSG